MSKAKVRARFPMTENGLVVNTLISDVRVGRHEVKGELEYTVVVPGDKVLSIEVERQIQTLNNKWLRHLDVVKFHNGTRRKIVVVDGEKIEVTIEWEENSLENPVQEFIISPRQPFRPVEVKMMFEHPYVVYTINDDAMSFTEFIMTLRRITAEHPDHEDILDGYRDLLNLSSTRENPVHPKRETQQPRRWIHVKLQVEEDKKTTSCTTLLMRDDTLYVCGFVNNNGDVYQLVDNTSQNIQPELPTEGYNSITKLEWAVSYTKLLGDPNEDKKEVGRSRSEGQRYKVITELARAHLGHDFAIKAVRRLSNPTHPDELVAGMISARLALAGLIVMVCESARMNPLHDAFARGWKTGTGFTENLMRDYVWEYGNKSRNLLEWKRKGYTNLRTSITSQVQDIYLVCKCSGGDSDVNDGATMNPLHDGEDVLP